MKGAPSAPIFVNKLSAATQQLRAAIRLYFLNEDELAVHSIAHSSFVVLKDVSKRRGGDVRVDGVLMGVLALARLLEDGTISQIPSSIEHPVLRQIVEDLRKRLRHGEIKTWKDVNIFPLGSERSYWKEKSKYANYLKHADRDHLSHMDVSSMDSVNLDLLISACATLAKLMGQAEIPEVTALGIYCLGDKPNTVPGLDAGFCEMFKKLNDGQRRAFCFQRYILSSLPNSRYRWGA